MKIKRSRSGRSEIGTICYQRVGIGSGDRKISGIGRRSGFSGSGQLLSGPMIQECETDPPAETVEDDEVLEVDEVTSFRDMDEVKTILRQLEDYCNRTNSTNLSLCYTMLTNFERENAAAISSRSKTFKQSSITSFFPRE